MARTKKKKGRVSGQAGRRRRFFNYPRSHVRSFRRWLPSWRIVVGTFLMGIALVVGVVVAAYIKTPIPDVLDNVEEQTTTVQFGNGTPLTTWYAENRKIIEYDTLPTCDMAEQFQSTDPGEGQSCIGNAVVASEDRTFWTNQGVDPKGIMRAFVSNVRGNEQQGASTLTQQYVERYYKGTTTSYAGKFEEAILALKISQKAAKDNEGGKFTGKKDILENYLNTIFFGRGAYGIEAAAKAYFGKSAAELDYSHAAMLAGIIPSPNNYDPQVNPEKAKSRWGRTLDFMVDDGYITAAQRAEAVFPTDLIEYTKSDRYAGPNGYIIQMIEDELVNSGQFTQDQLYTGGFTITSTINPSLQDSAVATMNSLSAQDPQPAAGVAGAIVSIDPPTGSILALYGGADYLAKPFNNATMGAAQGGSTFKPFTLIGALEDGVTLNERFNGRNGQKFGDWKVTNFGNANYGNIDLTEATAKSVNTVYAQLNEQIGPEKTAEVAERAGIGKGKVGTNIGNVLGDATVTPLELASAYATFANNGVRNTPHIVASVTDSHGNAVELKHHEPVQEFSPEVMAAATYAMTQVVEMRGGSGNPAQDLGRPTAGKTGTSSDNKSAWFAGYVPQLATVVGIWQAGPTGGQESIQPFGQWAKRHETMTGGTWPVRAWTSYMEAALSQSPVEEFPDYKPARSRPTQVPTETPSVDDPTPEVSVDEEPTPEVPQDVMVPDLAGQSADSARSQLKALGLRVTVTEEYSDQPKGVVVKVRPSGTTVPPGSAVTIVVSKGPQPLPSLPDPLNPDDPADDGGLLDFGAGGG